MEQYYLYHIKRPGMPLHDGYIGITNNPKNRFKNHRSSNTHVGNAIRKYDDIKMEILEMFDDSSGAVFQEMALRPVQDIGWNKAAGGGLPPKQWGNTRKNRLGMTNSKEHNEAISKANLGRNMTSEQIEKIRQSRLGKKLSDEVKANMSIAQNTVSDAEKQRRVDMGREYRFDHTGRVQSPEERQRRSEASPYKGKRQPEMICPHCNKIGRGSAMKQWHFDNCKVGG